MLNIKKILSAVCCVTTLATVGSINVNAEKEMYSLGELYQMSREEFFNLDGAEEYYSDLSKLVNRNSSKYMNMSFSTNIYTSKNYKYYETEKKIMELIGNDATYTFKTPVLNNENDYLDHYFWINIQNETYSGSEITDDIILKFAKANYCFTQVCDVDYHPVYNLVMPNVKYGDVNNDSVIDIRDASFLAKQISVSKGEDSMVNTADFNRDGKKDIRDASEIAKYVLYRGLAQNDTYLKKHVE